jgi:hypothetical protein
MAALGEVHHIVESAYAGRYTPGRVTAVPYILFGVLFLQALIRERHREKATPGTSWHPGCGPCDLGWETHNEFHKQAN